MNNNVDFHKLIHTTIIKKFANFLMKQGCKITAIKIINTVFHLLEKDFNTKAGFVFIHALESIKPLFEVRTKKIGGSVFKIPIIIQPHRQNTLAIKWLLETAKLRNEKTTALKIYHEILNINKNQSIITKKRDEQHKLANNNRAFMHYKW